MFPRRFTYYINPAVRNFTIPFNEDEDRFLSNETDIQTTNPILEAFINYDIFNSYDCENLKDEAEFEKYLYDVNIKRDNYEFFTYLYKLYQNTFVFKSDTIKIGNFYCYKEKNLTKGIFVDKYFKSNNAKWRGTGKAYRYNGEYFAYSWVLTPSCNQIICFYNENGSKLFKNGHELLASMGIKNKSYNYYIPDYYSHLYFILGDIDYKDGMINGVDKLTYLHNLNITDDEKFLNSLALNIFEGTAVMDLDSPKICGNILNTVNKVIRLPEDLSIFDSVTSTELFIDREDTDCNINYICDSIILLGINLKPYIGLKTTYKNKRAILKRVFRGFTIRNEVVLATEDYLFGICENSYTSISFDKVINNDLLTYWDNMDSYLDKVCENFTYINTYNKEDDTFTNTIDNTKAKLKETVKKMAELNHLTKVDKVIEYMRSWLLKNETADSLSFDVLKGDDIVWGYNPINYSTTFPENSQKLKNSCMNVGNSSRSLSYYINNPDSSLLVLKSNDKVVARAILWKINEDFYLDRIYLLNTSLSSVIREYCDKKGITMLRDTSDNLKKFKNVLRVKPKKEGETAFLDSFNYSGEYKNA